jgi:hypothetical protein
MLPGILSLSKGRQRSAFIGVNNPISCKMRNARKREASFDESQPRCYTSRTPVQFFDAA